jgi:hypothetical protein
MKRKLVCTNDFSNHWLRRRLPVEIVTGTCEADEKPKKPPFWRSEDMGLFLLSYFAFFTAISTFIF